MSEEQRISIEPGIYRHFKGNLYFVLGLAWSHKEWTNSEKAEVIYHPLYLVENLGWRRDRTLEDFFEHVDRPELNYSGPRFVKVLDWEFPDILPGKFNVVEYGGRSRSLKVVGCSLLK